ncbi:MAG: hypothetical protein GF349_04890 [Candidatus Magasanikbacteria bacterium]|nr:hypothetical protein [Candidatus Magasanikbacteria bacterium]
MIKKISHYPSLLVVCSAHEAMWYKIMENKIKLIKKKRIKKSRYSDKEGFFFTRGRGKRLQGGRPDSLSDLRAQERDDNLKKFAEMTDSILKKNDFVHLCCALPQRFKDIFLNYIESDSGNFKFNYGNYTNVSGQDEVMKIFKTCLRP